MPCVPCEGASMALSPTKKQSAGLWGFQRTRSADDEKTRLLSRATLPPLT